MAVDIFVVGSADARKVIVGTRRAYGSPVLRASLVDAPSVAGVRY